jgi:MoaA/NifB/PqqE/SkfB family radical SAM enzyme
MTVNTLTTASGARRPTLTPTLLWALRSPCSKGCKYCYFGLIEDHRIAPVTEIGELSHPRRDDLNPAQILEFAQTLPGSRIRRVFLAGGEPLIWPPIITLIRVLKHGGLQIIVCTEGTPLNRPEITQSLVELGVDAVSVSLDSVDSAYNDWLRPSRNGKDGWRQVVDGIQALVAARGDRDRPRVGIYSVITNQNLADIEAVPQLAQQLGCDYFVPQPLSLSPDHQLYGMCLTEQHVPELLARFVALEGMPSPVCVPGAPYPQQFAASISTPLARVTDCFGGQSLFFAQPDGTLWDCPSSHRIAATPEHRRRTILDADARALFGRPSLGCGDCPLFSTDCVNMWPLMDFAAIIGEPS